MKKFKAGDKVSFLNEKGGGIITKIVDEQLVLVAIEDGFEIPTAVSDIIKINSDDPDEPALIRHNTFSDDNEETDIQPLHVVPNDKDQPEAGIYVMIVPEIEDNPLVGNLDIFLVNHTSFQALFSLYLSREGKFQGEDYGFIESESRMLLKNIGRSEISEWANSLLQAVFFKEGDASPVKPISGFVNFKPIKVYKPESFKYEKLIRKIAMQVKIGALTDFQSAIGSEKEELSPENVKAIQDKINEGSTKKESKPEKESFLEKHKIDDKIAEIDIHIGHLVESYTGLSNKEMLDIQMDYFTKSMNQAENEKMSKVIFIHGVGNGVLKNEINKYLRNATGVEFHDASFARYGMGATEVVFYRNR